MESAVASIHTNLECIAPKLDEAGRQHILSTLSCGGYPLASAIADVQSQFSLNLPKTQCVIQFFKESNPDVSHASVHSNMFEGLKSQLNVIIDRMPQTALEVMLRETIDFIYVSELRPIPVSIMKRMHKIPEHYLQVLIAKKIMSVRKITPLSFKCHFCV
jgi:hypothetical protein